VNDQVYPDAAAKALARVYALFYHELIKEKVPPEHALAMTREWIRQMSTTTSPPQEEK
jgi:hypothetical protein